MAHGDYQDLVAPGLINDSVGKPLCSAPASSFGKLCPGFGVSQYPSDGVSDFLGEVITQSRAAARCNTLLPPPVNLSKLKKLIVFHLFFLGFNRRNTSSPGIALSSPLS